MIKLEMFKKDDRAVSNIIVAALLIGIGVLGTGKPIPKAKESLQKLKERGYIIIIWTTRNNKEEIAYYLKKLGIPFDYINENPFQPPDCSNKIYADCYVDDKAIEFRGDWQEVLGKILWKNGKKE